MMCHDVPGGEAHDKGRPANVLSAPHLRAEVLGVVRGAVNVNDGNILRVSVFFCELLPVWFHPLAVPSPRRLELDKCLRMGGQLANAGKG